MATESTPMTVAHGRSPSFYARFERKDDNQYQTHYCPGCGHGIVTETGKL